MSNDELIKALKHGGKALEIAIGQLHREHYSRLRRYTMRKVWDEAVADDLIQIAFLKLLEKGREQYRGEMPPVAYLTGILKHLIIDHFRGSGKWETQYPDDGDGENWLDNHLADSSNTEPAGPLKDTLNKEVADCIERNRPQLRELPEQYRAIYVWIVDDGLKPAQIAELLQRSAGATRQAISECRKHLRRIFGECYALIASQSL